MPMKNSNTEFCFLFEGIVNNIGINNTLKGFDFDAKDFNANAAKIALMHSELSEALEALRKPGESEHLPGESQLGEELADVFIRLAHFAYKHDVDLGDLVLKKMAFNAGRPYMHGKLG